MAERVGFEPDRSILNLQLTDSRVPTLPPMPSLPWRLAPGCTRTILRPITATAAPDVHNEAASPRTA
jgi:hypothetical protein